jgi:hypothetical protein
MSSGATVLLILGIFLGVLGLLIVNAALRVRGQIPRSFLVTSEVAALDVALHAYQERFGEFPPDGSDPAAVTRHLARVFPKSKDRLPIAINPSTALAFWLGGVPEVSPDGRPTGRLCGFSSNPLHPFEDNRAQPLRIGPFFAFDPARLIPGAYAYYPDNGHPAGPADNQPFIYFAAQGGSYSKSASWGNCRPFLDTRLANAYVNPTSFQILSPGRSGKYGTGRNYPSGSDYDADNYDEITNFTRGATLKSDMP